MKKLLLFLLILILILLLYCFFFRKSGCFCGRKGNPITYKHWINWNILFTPSSVLSKSQIIQEFRDSLTGYVNRNEPDDSLYLEFTFCPCDSLLTNLNATLVAGSGTTVNPPPPTGKPTPQGDFVVSKNLDTYMSELSDSVNSVNNNMTYQDTAIMIAGKSGALKDKILAVIDTGLDTLLFHKVYPNTTWAGNMLWSDPAKPTLFDVVLNEPNDTIVDDNEVKHGTDATFITINQIKKLIPSNQLPKIMSIRAFDKDEKGSIYTVSCALSYAIQHNADYINASWGYFGGQDPVLKRYIYMADSASIRVIAAAGNSPIVHNSSKICPVTSNDLNNLDRLESKDSLFYPACYAPEFPNVVSVTQLNGIKTTAFPCYYQNFSSKYITVGAADNFPPDPCCIFLIPFLTSHIEGSSFATPAVTGILMPQITKKSQNIKSFIESKYSPGSATGSTATPVMYTNKGDVIPFNQKNN